MPTNLPHFGKGNEISSKLTSSRDNPEMQENGYPSDGGIFLSVADGDGNKETIKLSNMEALDLALSLRMDVKRNKRENNELWKDRSKKKSEKLR